MIKLIASDVDGTLVGDGEGKLDTRIVKAIRALHDKGIHFAVASGRQWISIENVFEEVKDKIFYISIYSILSFITGLCGLVLTAMIFSKHPTVSFNLQILILNPLNILWLFPKIRKAKNFRLLMITCYLLGTIGSFFQSFADGIQLLAFVLLITSIYSYKVTQQVNTTKL